MASEWYLDKVCGKLALGDMLMVVDGTTASRFGPKRVC
jgi:hypothetical protein